MGLAFFGLTLEISKQVRLNLFKGIHEIVFHGKGGYDYYTIYNMPIWLRKYTFSQIKEFYEESNKPPKQTDKSTLVNSDGTVNKPEFLKYSKEFQKKSSYK